MCSVPGQKRPQPNTTYKGHEYSPQQAKEAEQMTTAYNAQRQRIAYKNVVQGRKGKDRIKQKPINQTKFYHPAVKAWDEYDASVQAAKSAPKQSAPVADDPSSVLKTGSDLGQAKVRKQRDPQAFGRAMGRQMGKMTIR